MTGSFFDLFLDIVCPTFCVGCGRLNCFICGKCYEKIEFFSYPISMKKLKKDLGDDACFVDEIWAMGNYATPLSTLIKTYKYKKVKNIGYMLAEVMYYTMAIPYLSENNIIISSVPLHKKRFQKRGFNQAEIIARKLSLFLAKSQCNTIKYQETLLRIKNTSPQASVSNREDRFARLKNTYVIHPTFKTKNSTIFLIDDVTTTGTTFNECAKILKEAGAKKVVGLAVAHE